MPQAPANTAPEAMKNVAPMMLSGLEPVLVDASSLFVNIGERTNVTGSKGSSKRPWP